jgi:hypothetical protein
MENTSLVADLPEDVELHFTLNSDRHFGGVFTFKMIKGSPMRRLLELQEVFEIAYGIKHGSS